MDAGISASGEPARLCLWHLHSPEAVCLLGLGGLRLRPGAANSGSDLQRAERGKHALDDASQRTPP